MPALVTNHTKAREKLRGQARGKKEKNNNTNKPKLGAGMSVIKSQKEIAESELNQKLAENEEKRRQWLMNWHLEVDQMQRDLYDMETTLKNSLVRTDSAKKRDKDKHKDTTAPKMTDEELEKLPIRMRPRPKYKPYMSQKERSDLNFLNFRKVIRNLHDNPRKFDVFTPDDFRPLSSKSRLPQIQIGLHDSEQYKVLIRKHPFDKNFEKNAILQRSRTEFLQVPHMPGKPYFKPNVTSRSADLGGKLPSLKIPSMPDLRNGVEQQHEQVTLPRLDRQESILSPVKETVTKPHKETADKMSVCSASNEDDLDSVESDESGYLMAAKAKRQNAQKLAKQQETNNLALPPKNEPNLLEDANFRKNLIQELDEKRQERSTGNKWGLVKNAFKATNMLKVKMPDVIKDEAKNKHHNRALDQVKERIKARGENSGQPPMTKGLSQSMNALDKIGKPPTNRMKRTE